VHLLTRPAVRRRYSLVRLAAAVTPTTLALGRTGAGVVMLVRPRLMPQLLGVDPAGTGGTAWIVQMLGAREVALGFGALAALRSDDRAAARSWVAAGALCDALDVLAVGAAVASGRLSKPVGGAVVASALSAAFAGVRAVSAGPPRG